MRLYPDLPRQRTAALARDAATLLALGMLAWLGTRVHSAVLELTAVGQGVQDAGRSVQSGFDRAADAVGGVPIVGGQLGEALRDASGATGGEAVEAGAAGIAGIERLATLLGWLTFGVPALLLLALLLPPRLRQVRRLTDAARALDVPQDDDRRRLVASRAAFNLPFGVLLRHTSDPLGDLQAGRYDALVAAAYEEAGLRAPDNPHERIGARRLREPGADAVPPPPPGAA
jgi:hypothetical protein